MSFNNINTMLPCSGLFLLVLLTFPSLSTAGGTSYAGAGSKGLGRAGAFAVKADDTSAILYNPANLAAIPGIQIGLGLQIAISRSCFKRAGTYGDEELYEEGELELSTPGYESIYGNGTNESLMNEPFSKVCNGAGPQLIPEIGITWRIHPKVGIGFGVVAPPGIGKAEYGEKDKSTNKIGIVKTNSGAGLPAPTRYMLVEMNQMAFFPSLSIGISPIQMLRIGLTAGWGIFLIDQKVLGKPLQGEWFTTDSLTEIEVRDIFVPRITTSLMVEAIENRLEAMAFFTWQADVEAKGSITYTTGYYANTDTGFIDKAKANNVRLALPQPWQAGAGVRFIIPRNDRKSKAQKDKDNSDGMRDEIADVELDVVYEMNSRVDAAVITQEKIYIQPFLEEGDMGFPTKMAQNFVWKDQVSIRLGGDVNVLHDRLALRLGLHYETHGVVEGWEQINFMPFQRLGVHAGLTARIRIFDVNLGYGFIYQFPVTLGEGKAKQKQVVGSDERGSGTIVNKGRFTSSYHVIGLGITLRFI